MQRNVGRHESRWNRWAPRHVQLFVIPIPTDRSGLILREHAVRAGFSEADLDEAVTRDHLVCLGPGVFAIAVGYLLWSRG